MKKLFIVSLFFLTKLVFSQNDVIIYGNTTIDGTPIGGNEVIISYLDSDSVLTLKQVVTDMDLGIFIDTLQTNDFYGEFKVIWENDCNGDTTIITKTFSPDHLFFNAFMDCSTTCPSNFNIWSQNPYVGEQFLVREHWNDDEWDEDAIITYSIEGGAYQALPENNLVTFTTAGNPEFCLNYELPHCSFIKCKNVTVWDTSMWVDFSFELDKESYFDTDRIIGKITSSHQPNVTYSWRFNRNQSNVQSYEEIAL